MKLKLCTVSDICTCIQLVTTLLSSLPNSIFMYSYLSLLISLSCNLHALTYKYTIFALKDNQG
jgi:hypothetical protein